MAVDSGSGVGAGKSIMGIVVEALFPRTVCITNGTPIRILGYIFYYGTSILSFYQKNVKILSRNLCNEVYIYSNPG